MLILYENSRIAFDGEMSQKRFNLSFCRRSQMLFVVREIIVRKNKDA
jgi:hypothetical protein